MASCTPAGKPITFPYTALPEICQQSFLETWKLLFAHSLTARRACLNTLEFGTSLNISSVTRGPLRLFRHASSSPFRILESASSRSIGTRGKANLPNIRSMEIESHLNLIIGTNASGTGASSATSGRCRNMSNNTLKKSSRVTCFGTTTSVSISEPAKSDTFAPT